MSRGLDYLGSFQAQLAADQLRRKKARLANPQAASGGAMKFEDVAAPAGLSAKQAQAATLAAGIAGGAITSASGGEGAGAALGSALSGAATGFAIGGGPVGAGIGAGAGLVMGIMGSKAKRKARQQAAMARKWENIAAIKQREGAQKQAALQSIMSGLRSAYLGR